MEEKICKACGETKAIAEFRVVVRNQKSYFVSHCILCERATSKAWRNANPEKVKKNNKAWKNANPEKVKENNKRCHKIYYQNNPEKVKLAAKEFVLNNPEWVRERRKIYRQSNKESHYLRDKAYRNSPAKYEMFEHKIGFAEKLKINDKGELLAKCAYCARWMVPTVNQCFSRYRSLMGFSNGECRFYCSDGCKKSCPIYGVRTRYKSQKIEKSSREVQPELRQMTLLRDNYTCQSCGDCGECVQLHVHHIKAVADDPIESADLDNVITLCKDCHKAAHSKPGCGYHELKNQDCAKAA